MKIGKAIAEGLKTAVLLVCSGYLLGVGFSLAHDESYRRGYRDGVDKCVDIVKDVIEKKDEEDA